MVIVRLIVYIDVCISCDCSDEKADGSSCPNMPAQSLEFLKTGRLPWEKSCKDVSRHMRAALNRGGASIESFLVSGGMSAEDAENVDK